MAELRAWAREKGYYSVPLWEKALRGLELVAAPALAFVLLAQGGVAAALGALILGLHYPRTAYLGHDLAHGQWAPRNETKARIMLRLVSLGQGFGSTWWVEKHELHHAFPNACRVGEDGIRAPIDGDIDSPPWLVWDKSLAQYNAKARQAGLGRALTFLLPRFQVSLFFPILSVARFNWSWQSIDVAVKNKQWTEATLCVAHWVVGFTLAGLITPGAAWTGWLWFFASQLLGGFILAFVFVLNHTGMEVYEAAEAKGFYDRQARATRNTPSSPLHDWLTGGLNSQIEHHMFPSLSRRRLAQMREATKAAMLESGYPYVTLDNRNAIRAVLCALGEAARA
ncbi:fatty acid desaturase [Methylocystis bryophila]|uniref:fatty acid desaturase n=1 Tax=Methylocystis bryophila TaxID=655015 RepID=UPI001FD9DAE1|nr:fatty acid desaturase [Methylocystis bryophila]